MKNKMKKILLTFVTLCMFIIGTGLPILANDTSISSGTYISGYDYPIKPGTREWIELGDSYDRVQACQIPDEKLKKYLQTN